MPSLCRGKKLNQRNLITHDPDFLLPPPAVVTAENRRDSRAFTAGLAWIRNFTCLNKGRWNAVPHASPANCCRPGGSWRRESRIGPDSNNTFTAYRFSPLVNNAGNDSPEWIKPGR